MEGYIKYTIKNSQNQRKGITMDVDKIKHLLHLENNKERIIAEDQMFESAVLIPIVSYKDCDYILFEKRSTYVSQPGEMSFPGGRKEKDDISLKVTAVRETIEELGVAQEDIQVLGKLGIMVHQHRSVIHCYVGKIQWKESYFSSYNPTEVEEIILVPYEEIIQQKPLEYHIKLKAYDYEYNLEGIKKQLFPTKQLKLPNIYQDEWDLGYRKIFVYPLENVTVWGITGRLLHELQGLYLENDNK